MTGRLRQAWDSLYLPLTVRQVSRRLRRDWIHFAAVSVCLGAGITCAVGVLAVVYPLVFAPPPYVRAPDEVWRLRSMDVLPTGRRVTTQFFSWADIERLRESRTFDAVDGLSTGVVSLEAASQRRTTTAAWVTARLVPTLGVPPIAGRTPATWSGASFPAAETGAEVMLSGAIAVELFGSTHAAVAQTVRIDQQPRTVAGVLPTEFSAGEHSAPQVWLSAEADNDLLLGSVAIGRQDVRWLRVILRASDGSAESVARRASQVLAVGATPLVDGVDRTAILVSGARAVGEGNAAREQQIATWLLVLAACLFVGALANAGQLQLARALRQAYGVAVQRALGASLRRLCVAAALEGAIVGVAAAAFGIGSAALVLHALGDAVGEGVGTALVLTRPALAAAVVLSVLAALGLFAVSLGVSARVSALHALSGGRATLSRFGTWLQDGLLIGQVAVTVSLLVAGGLLLESLRRLESQSLGIDPTGVVAVEVGLGASMSTNLPAITATMRRAAAAVATSVPGLRSVSVAATIPLRTATAVEVRRPGFSLEGDHQGLPFLNVVDTGYFETIGTRVVNGRVFHDRDHAGAPGVVVVNQTLARMLTPRGDVLETCVVLGSIEGCRTVVGVVEDARRFDIVRERPAAQVYVPVSQNPFDEIPPTVLLVRTRDGAPANVVSRVEEAAREAIVGADYVRAMALADAVAPQLRPWRLGLRVLAAFSTLSLVVAAVGVCAAGIYRVTSRRRELAIRIALGAPTWSVATVILRHLLLLTVVGTALGWWGASLLASFIRSTLSDVNAVDPRVIILALGATAVGFGLGAIAPVARATGVSPVREMTRIE